MPRGGGLKRSRGQYGDAPQKTPTPQRFPKNQEKTAGKSRGGLSFARSKGEKAGGRAKSKVSKKSNSEKTTPPLKVGNCTQRAGMSKGKKYLAEKRWKAAGEKMFRAEKKGIISIRSKGEHVGEEKSESRMEGG